MISHVLNKNMCVSSSGVTDPSPDDIFYDYFLQVYFLFTKYCHFYLPVISICAHIMLKYMQSLLCCFSWLMDCVADRKTLWDTFVTSSSINKMYSTLWRRCFLPAEGDFRDFITVVDSLLTYGEHWHWVAKKYK